MFVDYGDLSGVSAEAVRKWEESLAQTNAHGRPVGQETARGAGWHHPQGRIQYVDSGEPLLGTLVQL